MVSSSSSTFSRWPYDVFLSFRGDDTRGNFVSHLYRALCEKGIYTFRDDKRLEKGKLISPELHQAIELSRFSIIILSENYASSSWCLDELLAILDCMLWKGAKVFPIFYNVDPSDVRKQKGTFAKAFAKHEKSFRNDCVQRWREALNTVASLSGWDSRNRDESLLIKDVIESILEKLEPSYPAEDRGLVGMSVRVRNIISRICMPENTSCRWTKLELDGVRIVGIWGMGGIGKTTVARATFDRIAKGFDASCFLANVREESNKYTINYLQRQLLSRTLKLQHQDMDTIDIGTDFIKSRLCHLSVLIVLDDVDSIEQLDSLAGAHNWFGKGSIIMVTSRKRDILRGMADEIYEVEGLPENSSMELFCRHAFKQVFPDEFFMKMSEWVVDYTKGNPLALKILGSYLLKRSRREWESAIDKLKRMPEDRLYNVLKVSFDDLDSEQQDAFLDIGCFFKGKEQDYVVEVLDSCNFSTEINLSVLIDRCLVYKQDTVLWMHDLIQVMSQEIVRRESPKEHGKRSRLMCHEHVNSVLGTNSGTKKLEGIVLETPDVQPINGDSKAFLKMHGLRLLIFDQISFAGPSGGFETLPAALKYVHWQGYPHQNLPLQYNLENLVILNMPESRVEQLWEGTKHPTKLKVLNLKFSKSLIKVPDLSAATRLEVLHLNGCTSLLEVHPSVGCLKRLRILNLEGCVKLQTLPDGIHLESLNSFILSGCEKLKQFPEITGKMNCFLDVALNGTAIEELPPSIDNLTGLVTLNLEGCRMLKNLPKTICNLKYLKTLIIANCTMLNELPENLDKLESLQTLDGDGSGLTQFPVPVTHLKRVERLSLEGCKVMAPWALDLPSFPCFQHLRYLNLSDCNLVDVTGCIGQLLSLRILDLSRNSLQKISESIGQLASLEHLDLSHCKNIKSVQLPWNLRRLNADSCSSLEAIEHSDRSLEMKEHSSRQFQKSGACETGHEYQIFLLTNCSKLDDHEGLSLMETILLNYHAMAAKWNRRKKFIRRDHIGIWFPGNEIPEWFTHCADGCSIKMELPSNELFNYYQGAMVLGVVVSFPVGVNPKIVKLIYTCELGGKTLKEMNIQWVYNGESPSISSDHVVLLYIPTNWIPFYGQISQNLPISINFKLFADKVNVIMKKCGISLIDTKYEGDNIQAEIYGKTPSGSHFNGIVSNKSGSSSDRKARVSEIRNCRISLIDPKYEGDNIQAEIYSNTPCDSHFSRVVSNKPGSSSDRIPRGVTEIKKCGISLIDTKYEEDNIQAEIYGKTPSGSHFSGVVSNKSVSGSDRKPGGVTEMRNCGISLIDTKYEGDNIQAEIYGNTPSGSHFSRVVSNKSRSGSDRKLGGVTEMRNCGMSLIDTKYEGDNIQAEIYSNTPSGSHFSGIVSNISGSSSGRKPGGVTEMRNCGMSLIDTKYEGVNIQAEIYGNTPSGSHYSGIVSNKSGSSSDRKSGKLKRIMVFLCRTGTRCSCFR